MGREALLRKFHGGCFTQFVDQRLHADNIHLLAARQPLFAGLQKLHVPRGVTNLKLRHIVKAEFEELAIAEVVRLLVEARAKLRRYLGDALLSTLPRA